MSWTNADDLVVLLCTVPDAEVAERLARLVVDSGQAACVNIVPGLRSIYRWEGKTCDDAELLLLIKTRRERAAEVAAAVVQAHPYDNPEVISLPMHEGLTAYLGWVREMTTP